MDSQILYSLAGIVIFILIIIFTLRSGETDGTQTKEQKKQQIINGYQEELISTLKPLDGEIMLAKKTELLKKYSDELSRNIFFDKEEIREIIQYLSKN